MPAHKGIAFAKLIEQPGGLEHDVWADELLHAIENARMGAQIPGPTKIEVRTIEPRDASAQCRAGLVDFGAKVSHLVFRENRDRVEETKFLVIRELFCRES